MRFKSLPDVFPREIYGRPRNAFSEYYPLIDMIYVGTFPFESAVKFESPCDSSCTVPNIDYMAWIFVLKSCYLF